MERHASTWKARGPNIPSIRCPLTKGSRKNNFPCLGAETPVWQGARTAHTPVWKGRATPSDWMDRRPNWGSYSCASPKQRYAPVVIRRTIDEFVTAKDTRLIGILKDLLQYPDVYVQVRGIPLWTLESPTLFPFSPIFVANPNGLRFTQPLIVSSNC